MMKFYLVDFLKKNIEQNNNNQLVKFKRKNIIEFETPEEFKNFLKEFESSQLVNENLIKSILHNYFPKNMVKSIETNKMTKENSNELKKTIDALFYTNLEENTEIDEYDIQKFISFILNEIIKKIVIEYCFKNSVENKLFTSSENNLELLQFEFMNKYDFLSHYFESFVHLLTVFLAIESDIFTRNIEISDDIKNKLLVDTSKFYNILIEAYSKLKKDKTIFRINVIQDKRMFPSKNEVLKYDCYQSLDNLLISLDESNKTIDNIIKQLLEHKKLMRDRIKENNQNKKETAKEIITFVTELIGSLIKGF